MSNVGYGKGLYGNGVVLLRDLSDRAILRYVIDVLVFRRMIAPWILQVAFWACVCVTVLAIGGLVLWALVLQGDPHRTQNDESFGAALFAVAFGALPLALVIVRVLFEIIIVAFRISETLTDIRSSLIRPAVSADPLFAAPQASTGKASIES